MIPNLSSSRSARRIPVGPFGVDDLSYRDLLALLVHACDSREPLVAFVLHVGGLLHSDDWEYVAATRSADLHYADGAAIVRLGRLSGAQLLERSPTTDLAPDLLDRLPSGTRVGLIGGPPGLAIRAARVLEEVHAVEIVYAFDGFGEAAALEGLPSADVVFVGMGAPREMKWVAEQSDRFGHAVVLTCGGWFGFVVGNERRAPALVQRANMEWAWRWAQAPVRLGGRYAYGFVEFLRLYVRTLSGQRKRYFRRRRFGRRRH